MLRSFTVLDPHLVNNIRENPRYTKMTPEEILGKFVSGRMMIKEARYVDDALNGPIHEPQTVAIKATRSKEVLPSKVAQVEVAGLNEEEMALIIKHFKTTLRGRTILVLCIVQVEVKLIGVELLDILGVVGRYHKRVSPTFDILLIQQTVKNHLF